MRRGWIWVVHIEIICLMILLCIWPWMHGIKEVSWDTLHSQVKEVLNEKYEKEDALFIRQNYHLDSSMYQQGVVYTYGSSMEVYEVALFEQADERKRAHIKRQVKQRQEQKANRFKGYQEEKYNLIKNGILIEIGNYICFIVDDDATHLQQVIRELFL